MLFSLLSTIYSAVDLAYVLGVESTYREQGIIPCRPKCKMSKPVELIGFSIKQVSSGNGDVLSKDKKTHSQKHLRVNRSMY